MIDIKGNGKAYMMRLIHSSCTAVRTERISESATEEMKVRRTAVILTVIWNCRNLRTASLTARPHIRAVRILAKLSSMRTMAICICVAAISLPWAIVVRLFPDPWFHAIAKFVGTPVVLVYRPLSRGMHRLGRKIKALRKKDGDEDSSEDEVEQEAADSSYNPETEKPGDRHV